MALIQMSEFTLYEGNSFFGDFLFFVCLFLLLVVCCQYCNSSLKAPFPVYFLLKQIKYHTSRRGLEGKSLGVGQTLVGMRSLNFWHILASPLTLKHHMNGNIHASVTYTSVPTISCMKAPPHESTSETIPQSLSMSLDCYAIKLNESLPVSLSLWSFPDLSLTAWEPPAKTGNEKLALTVVAGER